MKTRIVDEKGIKPAARLIASGSVVAFPTETVYGLGANALDPSAIAKIYAAKGRPSDNPLIVHIASKKDVTKLAASVPPSAKKLMDKFWPGPLTIILKKKPVVPLVTTGGLDSVAIRMPSNKIALALIKESRVPIAAPSANLSGKPSPTTAEHVISDMDGRIPMIISGGHCTIGLESTVIDMSSGTPMLLRPGKISLEELRETIGEVHVSPIVYASKRKLNKVRSPGMKYRHYSPNATVIVVIGTKKKVASKIGSLIKDKKALVVSFHKYDSYSNFICSDASEMARVIFDKFREADSANIPYVIVEGVSNRGIGLALMNRIKKAATEVIEV